MDISLFLSLPLRECRTALCPRFISKEALPFSPMTQKGDLQFLIFLKRCII